MVEKIIEFSARNRLLVLVGVAFALFAAVNAIRRVDLDAIPDLSEPQVIVFTEWMGRSPTLVEDQVTYPIVSSLISAPKVVDVRGSTMFGMSFVYVIFEEGTDLYWARSRVNELLGTLRDRLPPGVTPQLGPDATGIGWIFQYAVVDTEKKLGLDELRTLQDFTLRYAIGQVPGVAEVASVGGYQKQYQVTVDPNRLKAFGLSLQDVISALRDSNSDVGGRVLEFSGREYYVRGRGYVQDLASLEDVVVSSRGPTGTPVLVKDLGSVRFGPDIRRGLMEWNGEGEGVGGVVVMRYGENALTVIDAVKEKIAELAPGLPPGVKIEIAYDRSDLIHRSIDTLKHALFEEALVVALVIILFLLHLRSAMLPILSLPVAVALGFIPMYLLDIPSTIMSLGGIAIAIGATVDAEIVMIEASHKKLEHAPPGADRRKLLAEAAREVTPAIFFSLLIIAVSFLPVFTLTGQAGRLFKPLAYTKTFVMLAAALVSITFAPALRDVLLRGHIRSEDKHPISRFIIRLYKPFVFVALRWPRSTLAIGLFAVLSAVPLALRLGHEFMPPLNEGDVLYMPTTFPNLSIEEAKRQLQVQDRVLRGFPEVLSVFGKVGRAETATDPAPLTMAETAVRLKPPEEWRKLDRVRWYSTWAPEFLKAPLRRLWPEQTPITWDELTTLMNQALQMPGWTNAWTMPIKTRVDMLTTGVRTPVGVKVYGTNLDEIEKVGTLLEGMLAPIPGTRSVLYERNLGGLYVDVIPDRKAMARYGLTVGDVQRVVEAAIGGATIGTTVEGRNRFSINVRYPQDLRDDVEKLRQVLIPIRAGGAAGSAGGGGMGEMGAVQEDRFPLVMLAMGGMGGGAAASAPGVGATPDLGNSPPALDVGGGMGLQLTRPMAPVMGVPGNANPPTQTERGYVPLGQVAEVKVASGPPMIRDEGGFLVGYVYVDVDPSRDVGGYVKDAKEIVRKAQTDGTLTMPQGYFLKWTGQYELLEQMIARMKLVVPLTLLLVVLLLYLHFRNIVEVLIVLLSIPFALVGSVWLLWLLDYRLSTAVWVGVIALVGLAAQTGIVMIVYIDNAYERRRKAGKIRDLNDIIWAHMEGTVMRVRPKLMTVSTMLIGLLPLLWATGSGADVMKRIAAPMVGGLLTSAFLTLEIIPVVYTYWRQEQLLWERLEGLDPRRLARLQFLANGVGAGLAALVGLAVAPLFVTLPAWLAWTGWLAAAVSFGAAVAYLALRPAAKRAVWPTQA